MVLHSMVRFSWTLKGIGKIVYSFGRGLYSLERAGLVMLGWDRNSFEYVRIG